MVKFALSLLIRVASTMYRNISAAYIRRTNVMGKQEPNSQNGNKMDGKLRMGTTAGEREREVEKIKISVGPETNSSKKMEEKLPYFKFREIIISSLGMAAVSVECGLANFSLF